MKDRKLDAALLSDIGLVSSDVLAEFYSKDWTFVCSTPGHKGACCGGPACPSPCSCWHPFHLRLWWCSGPRCHGEGNADSLRGCLSASGPRWKPPPLCDDDYPARPPYDGSATYTRAEGEWQRGFVTRHVKGVSVSCCVVGGDFNETPDGFLDRAVRTPEGYDRGTSDGLARHAIDILIP